MGDRKDREIERLRYELAKVREENKVLSLIAKQGKAYINHTSTDCDGVHGQGSAEIRSIEEFNQFFEDAVDWIEGPFGYEVEANPIESRTWGQGWGIN